MKLYSIDQLFDVVHENSSTAKGHLGKYYIPLEDTKKKEKKIMKKLCDKGKVSVGFPLKTMTKNLNDVGIIIHNQTAYWTADEFRTNYMLQKGKNCRKS